MPALGLALFALYGLLAFGLRMVVQLRRTGSTGFKGLGGASGAAEWICGSGFAAAAVLCTAGPVLQLAGALGGLEALDGNLASILGAVLASLGIVITVVAQFAMGEAWRIGVDTLRAHRAGHRRPLLGGAQPDLRGDDPLLYRYCPAGTERLDDCRGGPPDGGLGVANADSRGALPVKGPWRAIRRLCRPNRSLHPRDRPAAARWQAPLHLWREPHDTPVTRRCVSVCRQLHLDSGVGLDRVMHTGLPPRFRNRTGRFFSSHLFGLPLLLVLTTTPLSELSRIGLAEVKVKAQHRVVGEFDVVGQLDHHLLGGVLVALPQFL